MSMTRTISSLQNSHVKRWVSLQDARGIERFRQCLVFGKKVVQETLRRHPARCLELLHPAKTLRGTSRLRGTSGQARVSFSIPVHVATYALSPTCFKHVDIFGTGCPILICTALPLPCADVETPPRGLELLCPLGDPANVGALLRTAAAMGANQVVLLKESAHPYHPKSIRAASGATFDVPLTQGPSVRDLPDPSRLRAGPSRPFEAQGNLRAGSATWVTLHVEGEGLPGFQWPKDVRLVVGEEGTGLPSFSAGKRLAIPMTESVESLNAVTAASMALYAYRVQHPLHRRSDHVFGGEERRSVQSAANRARNAAKP